MARVRTQGELFRRYFIGRLPATIVMFALFVVSLFLGSWPITIVFFVVAAARVGLTVWLFVLYKKADPEKLATLVDPIDASLRPSFRYLMPKKYPYVRPDEQS